MDYTKNPPYSLQPPTHFRFLDHDVFHELENAYPIESYSERLPKGANLLRSNTPIVRILSSIALDFIEYSKENNGEYDSMYFTVSTEPVASGRSQRTVARNWHLDGRLYGHQPLLLSASTSMPTEYLTLTPGIDADQSLHQTILADADEFNFSAASIQNSLDTKKIQITTPETYEATVNTARIHRSTQNTTDKLINRVWFGILLRRDD